MGFRFFDIHFFVGPQNSCGEGLEEVGAVVAGADDGAAPEADAFDDSGACEQGQHTGTGERTLAAAAGSEDEGEVAGLGFAEGALQQTHDLADGAAAAEEDGRVLKLEDIEIAEGTALPLGPRFDGVLADAFLDELAQLLVHQVLELVEVGVGGEVVTGDFVAIHGGGEDAGAGVAGEGGEEVLEGVRLGYSPVSFLLIQRWRDGRWRRGFVHPDEQVGQVLGVQLLAVQGLHQLVLGAGAGGFLAVGRELVLIAESRAEL